MQHGEQVGLPGGIVRIDGLASDLIWVSQYLVKWYGCLSVLI